jgi:hypothetical protein
MIYDRDDKGEGISLPGRPSLFIAGIPSSSGIDKGLFPGQLLMWIGLLLTGMAPLLN